MADRLAPGDHGGAEPCGCLTFQEPDRITDRAGRPRRCRAATLDACMPGRPRQRSSAASACAALQEARQCDTGWVMTSGRAFSAAGNQAEGGLCYIQCCGSENSMHNVRVRFLRGRGYPKTFS